MAWNEIAFSVEAAELIDKALKCCITTVLDKKGSDKELDLAEKLHQTFKAMYQPGWAERSDKSHDQ